MHMPGHTPLAAEIRRRVRRALRTRDLRAALLNSSGAIDLASIMVGVLVIGVIAGIIAATVFAVIPWSQDKAAEQSLSAVRDAESVAYTQGAEGGASKYQDKAGLLTGNLLQDSPKVGVATDAAGSCYVGVSKSATGKVFYVTDKTITATLLTATTDPGCLTPAELNPLISTVGGPSPVAGPGGTGGPGGSGTPTGGTPADTGGGLSLISNSYSSDWTTSNIEMVSPTGTTTIQSPIKHASGSYKDGNGVTFNGKFYFPATNTVTNVNGLGVFDGTTVSMVASDDMYIHGLTEYNGKLYFAARNYTTGTYVLNVFDGTTIAPVNGTRAMVRSTETYLTVLGTTLYFIGTDAANGYELWSYDGTTSALVSASVPGANASGTDTNTAPFSPFTVGTTLYFTGAGTNSGTTYGSWSVYTFTGTGAPTKSGIVVGKNQASYQVYAGKLFVKASGRLYRFDDATPVEVLDEQGGSVSQAFSVSNGRLFTARWNGSTNVEILEYVAGVMKKIGDAPANVGDLTPMGAAGANLYFKGYDNDNTYGRELWVFDGTNVTAIDHNPTGDTSLSLNFNKYGSNDINTISGTVGDTFYYYAGNLVTGADELWGVTGTTLVKASTFNNLDVFGTFKP